MTGDDLKSFRERYGLSQRGLARRIGYSHTMVSLWEAGKRTPIPERVPILLAGIAHDLQDEKRPQSEDQGR